MHRGHAGLDKGAQLQPPGGRGCCILRRFFTLPMQEILYSSQRLLLAASADTVDTQGPFHVGTPRRAPGSPAPCSADGALKVFKEGRPPLRPLQLLFLPDGGILLVQVQVVFLDLRLLRVCVYLILARGTNKSVVPQLHLEAISVPCR